MHFLIMDKYFNEDGFRIMKEYMVQNNISHTSVKPVPFLNIFVPEDVTDYTDASYEKYFDKSVPTMSFGSYALANQLVEEGYTPGGFINENFNIFEQMTTYWGRPNFLNGDASFGTVSNITERLNPIWTDKVFIRPVHDTKKMIATVIERDNFEYAINQFKETVSDDFEIMVSSCKDIISEYRLFIVKGEVVAWSLYKLHGEVRLAQTAPKYIVDKAEELCKKWVPADAFVMDFAETSEGYKVLEVNNINCAGFYACDIPSIVEAMLSL